MTKKIIIYGLIAGVISIAWVIADMVGFHGIKNYEGMLLGYSCMLVAFSLIFVAVKNYRYNNGGTITFGKAFRIGFSIAFIASTIYVLIWMIDYHFFIPDYYDKYGDYLIAQIKSSNISNAIKHKKIIEAQNQVAFYKNPFIMTLMTYVEILPVGLVISLLAALILMRKQKGEAAAVVR